MSTVNRAVTPKYYARTIGAGGSADIGQYGQYISIVSVSASTVTLSVDDEAPEEVVPGIQIDCGDYRYERLRLTNTGGVAATVILLISNVKVSDIRGNALTLAMAASLANIDGDTDNIADCEALLTTIAGELQGPTAAATFAAETTLAATTATAILPANANAHGRFIQAKSTNTASIYIGADNTVTDTKWMIELAKGQGYTFDDYRGPLYAYSVAGADKIAYGEW